jgi:phosphoglycolate phosphatase
MTGISKNNDLEQPQSAEPPGIIFDLDGTLLDTLADLTSAVNHAIEAIHHDPWPASAVRLMIGEGLPVMIRRAAETDDPDVVARVMKRFRAYYGAHDLDQTKPYPGAIEMLDQLVQRGVPLAVLSNKPDDCTRHLCEELLGRFPFAHVEGHRPDAPLKPDPTRALAICEILGRPPSRVYFVGDSPVDVETGRRGGMVPIAASWGYRDRPLLQAAKPLRIIDDPSELPAVLVSATA